MSDSHLRDLSSRLRSELLDGFITSAEPGAVIAVYRDGAIVASACAGLADTATEVPLSEDSLMNIASISKQIAATAVLIAARGGTLDLDADIRTLVPELLVPGVTLRNCLNHTAGLPDYLAVAYTVGMPEIEIAALEVFLDWVARVQTLEFSPGTQQSYSNTGYVLAALALERACGAPFPTVLAETVLQPLGMTESFSTTVLGEFHDGMAFSFTRDAGDQFVKEPMGVGEVAPVRGVNGDGEIITSVNQFGAWQAFLLDGRVLGEDIRQQLLTRTVLNDGTVTSYGLGIAHETQAHTSAVVHSGGMWGFSAYSIVDEASGISIACFANRSGFSTSEAAWKAMHFATGFGDIAGHWYSTRTFMGARLEIEANGDLAARSGLSEAPETVHWAGDQTWVGGDDFARVELHAHGLEVVSSFDTPDHYARLEAVTGYPSALLGKYEEPVFGKEFEFEDREGEIWLCPPGRDAERVVPFGRRQGEWIGETSLGWILIDEQAGDRVRIGLGSFSTELLRAPADRS